ncbi:MAG: OsmC family protein [Deltaproteobacteria bacterium]|nr:OsmC family protein [Deltaproteobacteria bacterium]
MMGTLATVLAKDGIRTHQGVFNARVKGYIQDVNGVLKITRIQVHYSLKLPAEKFNQAQEALEAYLSLCPAAQSVLGCIEIQHQLQLEEL